MQNSRLPGPIIQRTQGQPVSNQVLNLGHPRSSRGIGPSQNPSEIKRKLSDPDDPRLVTLKRYVDLYKNENSIAAFAYQIYFIAYHWFVLSSAESVFIDDCFLKAASEVLVVPVFTTVARFWDPFQYIIPSTDSLTRLGPVHLRRHIKPTYEKHLSDRINAKLAEGKSVPVAANTSISELRDEHEQFLTSSIPYGVSQLIDLKIIKQFQSFYTYQIQNQAREVRLESNNKVLAPYVVAGQLY